MTAKALSALTARFNRKIRGMFKNQTEKAFEASAYNVRLVSNADKPVGVRAVWGHEPKQKIHFVGIETPTRHKLRMRPTSFARVTWKRGNEMVRAWIKIEDDGRWVVGEDQIIESNAQL